MRDPSSIAEYDHRSEALDRRDERREAADMQELNSTTFASQAESSHASQARGGLHVRKDGGGITPAPPHTASGEANDGGHERKRVLAVKLDLRNAGGTEGSIFQRLNDLSWQAARYRNQFVQAKWAEAMKLCVDPVKQIPHDVTKQIRATEKMELSGAAYSAAEREVTATWNRLAKRILAGAPLPQWKTTAALSIRGHKNRGESGVRLTQDESGKFTAELQAQSEKCEGGCWLRIPLALGVAKDWQAEMLAKMARGEVAILKAVIVIKPMRHQVILRLAYALPIVVSRFGERKATLGPIGKGNRLWLRTEFESRDFTGRLHTLLRHKDDWDKIRRRVLAQIGRRKGSARRKRMLLSKLTWEGWLQNWLHQWSAEIIVWLKGQGIGSLAVMGLEAADFPAFRFTEQLKYKGEDHGISVHTEAALADVSTERAVKSEIQRKRRKATKAAGAIRELTNQIGSTG